MKTEWDYSKLASAYLKRPDYAAKAVRDLLSLVSKDRLVRLNVCDIGAGVGHLTKLLADQSHDVIALEPNDAMRSLGIEVTEKFENIKWFEGTAEKTSQDSHVFDLVTFGSSFNVTNHSIALKECKRILKKSGWFACMWNHRDLNDPIQSKIEKIIFDFLPNYSYGSRRQDPSGEVSQSGLFHDCITFSDSVIHQQSIADCAEAWRSHATLARQAGARFNEIVEMIEKFLLSLNEPTIYIPYRTAIWAAQVID